MNVFASQMNAEDWIEHPVSIVALVLVLVVWGWLVWQYRKKRRAGFLKWAEDNNFDFHPEKSKALARSFVFLNKLDKGSNRYIYDYLTGSFQGHQAHAFTFHYETYSHGKHGRRTHHHYVGVVAIELVKEFPELIVRPEKLLEKLGQMLGYQDIDFESVEFSKKFAVRSKDKKFAYDFCHTGMMEYLIAHPQTSLEVDQNFLAIYDKNRLEPNELDGYFGQIVNIHAMMPKYLFED